jgi:hypothetical protein
MFLQKNYLGSILLFFIVGLISTLYTKNMNIILFSTIIITNITVFVAKMFGYAEGFKEGKEGKEGKEDDKKMKLKKKDDKTKKINGIPVANDTEKKGDEDDEDKKDKEDFIGSRTKGGAQSLETITGEAFKESMQNNKGMDDDDDDDEGFKSIKEDIAESKNLTKSLRKNNISKDTEKEIKKMLKGTDLKNLNTNELIEQQKGLMDAMKNMDPLIKSVNEMIKNLKDSPISGFMGLGK